MIDELKGILEKKSTTHAVIFVGGVGFKLKMSINGLDSLPAKGNEVSVLTYLYVREDKLDLYGFIDSIERNTFNMLITISGIGPKLALTINSGPKYFWRLLILAGDSQIASFLVIIDLFRIF